MSEDRQRRSWQRVAYEWLLIVGIMVAPLLLIGAIVMATAMILELFGYPLFPKPSEAGNQPVSEDLISD